MTKKYRIEVDVNLHRALSLQATKAGMTLKEYVNYLLAPHVDKATLDFLGVQLEEHKSIKLKDERTTKPKDDKPRLTDNPEALEELKDLWRSGVRSRAELGRRVGYPKSTVAENVKKMIESGELEGEKTDEGEEEATS